MSGKSKKVKGTKQTLEYVEQPEKLHVKTIKCKNQRQKEFLNSIDSHEVTICNGLAGSGKTYVALYYALKALEKGQCDKIVLVKSVTTLDQEDIGFLPGDIQQKMDPFLYSYYGNIDKIIGEEWRKRLVKEGKIQVQPLAYIRGINIDNAVCIIDEC
jgi:phosphate starvation-inducible PhoH-like protein